MNAYLSDFPAEDGPDLPWHIDPRDKDPRDEDARQAAFLKAAAAVMPKVRFFAVPNAGRRSQWEARKRLREGMRKGVPDIVATWNRGVAFLEWKNGTEKPSPDQREWLNALYAQGQHVGVFRQEASALVWLRSIGAPCLAREGL